MSLTPEQQKELTSFPAALRALVEAELAAGNSIDEVGHGFPAPPVGAYLKLAIKVSTRPRETGDGLHFYERNGSSYSGEFTDAQRFYFVLEPANPPPPELDMDAARKALEPKPDLTVHVPSSLEAGPSPLPRSSRIPKQRSNPGALPRGAYSSTETATRAVRVLHFQDPRPPHEIQFVLERDLMRLFSVTNEDGRYIMRATASVNGGPYDFELRFEEALAHSNCYSLKVETSWAEQAATRHDYYRKTSASWFDFWTREFDAAPPAAKGTGSASQYQTLCDAAARAERHLDSVPAVQQAIVAAMKRGASFATSHKEGGTNIFWRDGRFVRSNYGDSPGGEIYDSEEKFLTALRQYFDGETSRNYYPNKAPEFEAWKLILRLLRAP